jgi:F-type H+/Na+-transporting ATPase subunit alpha
MTDQAQHATVFDSDYQHLGGVYAKALLGATEKQGSTDEALEQLGSLLEDVLAKLPQLSAVLESPRVPHEEKVAILDKAFGSRMNPILMKFNADEIARSSSKRSSSTSQQIDVREVGTVLEVGDGHRPRLRAVGRDGRRNGRVPRRRHGLAFNLEENSVGVIILGDYLTINEGDEVRSAGQAALSVPVGEAVIGRVLDPLGNPLDGKGPVNSTERRPVEVIAPGVAERQPVYEPLQTGIKAIDAMTPIGRGQRELIIGDRKTGKTAIASTRSSTRRTGVKCFYVAIGQKDSSVAGVIEDLRKNGAMDYTTVIVSGASSPAPLQYVAPYAGTAMAEYFMYKGQHALIVYDDLSSRRWPTASCRC